MKFKALTIALLLSAANAYAEVPHTFSAGTPAKASEVNANFEYLDGKIQKIQEWTENPTVAYKCKETPSDYAYTYNRKTADLGRSFYIGSTEYKLTKFPHKDSLTGDIYHITMPIQVRTQTTPYSATFVSFSPSINALNGDYSCKDMSVFGTSFVYNITTGFKLTTYKNYSNDGDNDTSSYDDTYIRKTLSYYGTIAVGSMMMSISISKEVSTTETIINTDDYDFTDDEIVEPSLNLTPDINQMSAFLDHIYIEKIEQ